MTLTATLFLLAFTAGCLCALTRHPIYGLLTYVGVFYVLPQSRWWGQGWLMEVRWVYIAAGVTLLATLIHKPKSTVPVFKSGVFWGLVMFVAWIAIQSLWALDVDAHSEMITLYLKFIALVVMICRCIDTEQRLRMFCWAHVLGGFYFGWTAYTSYQGGRFEDFGGSGLSEANAAALQLVTTIVVAGSLFLAGSTYVRAALLVIIPIIVNAMVTTISRSGFLAAAAAGVVYNLFTSKRYRVRVWALSILAAILFGLLTNSSYWERIDTIKYEGQEVEGVDTGGGRPQIIEAQWRMFAAHPFGCGHMCTTALSEEYIDKRFLASQGGRASHNTFMTMLVDHGIPGVILYVGMLIWTYRSLRTIARRVHGTSGFLSSMLPAMAGVMAAIAVGEQFVQYTTFEARFWFVALLIVVRHLTAEMKVPEAETSTAMTAR